MSEALSKILDYGFNRIGLKKIEAFTHKNNLKSTAMLLKNNFKHDVGRTDKDNENNIIFSITRANFL